jgi:hypothetical protein
MSRKSVAIDVLGTIRHRNALEIYIYIYIDI